MNTRSTKKKILVLSDSDKIARVIELTLNGGVEIQVARPALKSQERSGRDDIDLIVVAASSPSSEPVVMLARNSLTGCVGKIPLLIISDRPFEADLEERITYLSFPFNIDELRDEIQKLLRQPTIIH